MVADNLSSKIFIGWPTKPLDMVSGGLYYSPMPQRAAIRRAVKMFKVYLCNVKVIGQRCGFGEGATRESAIADALVQAKARDENAKYNPNTGTVDFDSATVHI